MSVKDRQKALFGGGAPPGRTGGGPKSLSRIMFDKFDADQSGKIDQQEFKALCYDFGYFLNDDELELAVKELDTHGGSEIAYEDFVKWWNQNDRFEQLKLDDEALELRRKASETFQKFDADHSGTIDANGEFTAFYNHLKEQNLTDKDEQTCLEDLDQNRDGVIQFNEYVDWLVRIGTLKVQTFMGAFQKFQGGENSEGIKEGQAQKAKLRPTKTNDPTPKNAGNKPQLRKTASASGSQGGKAYGMRKGTVAQQCDELNEEYAAQGHDDKTLTEYKTKFMEYDEDGSGDIDIMELGRMMEKLGQPKNQIQLRKMIQEVDQEGGGTITYRSFLNMMLGGNQSSILAKILAFERLAKKDEAPKGKAPKRSLADLP